MIHGPTLRSIESTKLNRGLSLLRLLIPLYTQMMIWQMLRDAAQKCGQICHWAIEAVGSHLEAAVSRKRKAEDEPPELQSFGWNCFSGVGWESWGTESANISGCWSDGWKVGPICKFGLRTRTYTAQRVLGKGSFGTVYQAQKCPRKHGMLKCLWLFGRSWMVPKLFVSISPHPEFHHSTCQAQILETGETVLLTSLSGWHPPWSCQFDGKFEANSGGK